MTTGGVHAETFKLTMEAGAIAWGCWSIKPRISIGGFQVGCYSVADYDGDANHLRDWLYFAMCNHGSKSGGADTRKDTIVQAKQSMHYCDECAILAEDKQNSRA
jgi:hypothetical protein